MIDILEKMFKSKIVIVVLENILVEELCLGKDIGGMEYDLYVWFDVSYWMYVIEVVCDMFVEVDLEYVEEYKVQVEQYLIKLEVLDFEVWEKIQEILEVSWVLVMVYDVFGYFG